ncbi:MAG: DUF362 domain-containing protein [Bacillota bacterium]|jgi:uncharacterized protein (DUF362 family)|nr:DUF362 domain-containing protein [Bacillota bacterium]NLU55303.1 DUF362 domain-containing protein [Bacillota bacterium]HOA91886.1 DUF362 domain-containing protein [Bacillota bacterium]HOJ45895.1 DUF362 domain-containing protein [Bacillota bacterium]HOL13291.1 DUF362 domain-containing protein [Bacillota bacterium]
MLVLLLALLLALPVSGYTDRPYYYLSEIKNTTDITYPVAIRQGAKPPKQLSDGEVEKLVHEAMSLADFDSLLTEDVKTIMLKPNIVEPFESGSGVITDYRVVQAAAVYIHERRPDIKIIVGEGAGGWVPAGYEWGAFPGAKAEDGFAVAGYRDMVAYLKKKYPDLDIEIIDINIPAEDIVEVVPKVPFADDKYYIHRMVRDADLLVTIPVLKIIETCQVTLGLKNNVGIAAGVVYGWAKMRGFPYTKNAGGLRHTYPVIDEEIADLVQARVPDFVIIDGIVGMEQDKTHIRRGIKKQANMIIAGRDPVAVDAAASRVMMLNPRDVEYITLCYYIGLGSLEPIIVGDPLEEVAERWIKPDTRYSPRGHFGQGRRIFEVAGDSGEFSEPILFMDTLINPWVLGDARRYTLRTGFELEETMDLELWVGSDCSMTVYLDGEPIYRHSGRRKHELPNDIVKLANVQAGTHEVEIILGQKGSFSLTIGEGLPRFMAGRDQFDGTTPLGLKWRWED